MNCTAMQRDRTRSYAHATIILTLHVTNTANITNVASINAFSKEANFITALRFLTPQRPYLIPREGHQSSDVCFSECR